MKAISLRLKMDWTRLKKLRSFLEENFHDEYIDVISKGQDLPIYDIAIEIMKNEKWLWEGESK